MKKMSFNHFILPVDLTFSVYNTSSIYILLPLFLTHSVCYVHFVMELNEWDWSFNCFWAQQILLVKIIWGSKGLTAFSTPVFPKMWSVPPMVCKRK
jgi:hypothetical protein